jgi:hypothetical protein
MTAPHEKIHDMAEKAILLCNEGKREKAKLVYKEMERITGDKTTRSNCPSKKEDGVVIERMILKGDKLTYEFNFKETKFTCQYKKVTE